MATRPPGALPPTVTPPGPLAGAVRRMMRPLIKLMLHNSVQYPYLANLLKLTYVEVATHMPVPGKEQTDSRVSMLTGIHRMDVKRLRTQIVTGNDKPPPAVSLGAQAVMLWTTKADYLDSKGRPKPLPRLASSGSPASFESLVQSISKDIRPRVVLDEWLRLGIARVDAKDQVELVTDAFVPNHGLDEKLFYLGKNLHDHMSSCTHNLTRPNDSPLLDRSIYFDRLSDESAEILAAYARQLASQAMQDFGRKAMELQEKDSKQDNAKHRVTYGLYFYQADENSEHP